MAFNIKSEKTDKLARKVARKRKQKSLADRLNAFAKRFAALPDRDTRSADEILGYDEHGLPN